MHKGGGGGAREHYRVWNKSIHRYLSTQEVINVGDGGSGAPIVQEIEATSPVLKLIETIF